MFRASLLLLWLTLLCLTGYAQKAKTAAGPVKNRVIKGKITDYVTKALLPGMKVQAKDTYLYAVTDKYGSFHLALPDSLYQKTLVLETLYPTPGSAPEGTTILDVDINLDNISLSKGIKICRYPQEAYQTTTVTMWKKQIIDHNPAVKR